MQSSLFNYGELAMTLSHSSASGVGLVEYEGEFCERTFSQSQPKVRAALMRALGFVVDMRKTLISCSCPDWGVRMGLRQLSPAPGAIIVQGDALDCAAGYAAVMCSRGIPRRAFKSSECAETWLAAQIDLREAQARWRRARSRS